MEKDILKSAAESFPEAIPQPFKEIYRHTGFEGLYAVSSLMGGGSYYVPQIRSVLSKCIVLAAIEEYRTEGRTVQALARKYGFSRHNLMILFKKHGVIG